jgi:hypothetical protein
MTNDMNGSLIYKKPAILLITGAWHVPEHYAPLIALLRSYGYTVHCPLLPSNSQLQPPANLDDDILLVGQSSYHSPLLASHFPD